MNMSHVSHSKNSIIAIVIAVAIFIPGSKACLLWYTQYPIHPQTPTHTHTQVFSKCPEYSFYFLPCLALPHPSCFPLITLQDKYF